MTEASAADGNAKAAGLEVSLPGARPRPPRGASGPAALARDHVNGPGREGGRAPRTAAPTTNADLKRLNERTGEAARLLRLLANEKRLLVLCHLVGAGEMNVGDLAVLVGLSQSALSQHLAKLREDGLVATRREAQTIHYRLADPKAGRVLEVLHELYARPGA
jgi:ArsR family transcriptional regulator, virulence genes transcriptional regulator